MTSLSSQFAQNFTRWSLDAPISGARRRVVVLSSAAPSYCPIICALAEQHDVVLRVRPVPGPRRWGYIIRNFQTVVRRRLSFLWTQIRRKRLHVAAAQWVSTLHQGGIDETHLDSIPEVVLPMAEVNTQKMESLLRAAEPDLLVVIGAPILEPRIFSVPRYGAVNLHFGIAPRHRGDNTLFWALREKNQDGLGFTFHKIDRGIDSGAVLAYGLPSLDGLEKEPDIWVKCLDLARRMISDVITRLGEGVCLEDPGKLYLARHRTPVHDALEWLSPCPLFERTESVWTA